MLCERCHQREATCHAMSIEADTRASDLCRECFESSMPQEEKNLMSAGDNVSCQYCGRPSSAGGTDIFAMMTGKERILFMCMPCSQEFDRFTQRELERIPHGLTQPGQLAAIQAMRDQADLHMKQWASKRQLS